MFTNIINAEELLSVLHNDNIVIVDCRFFLKDTEAGRQAYRASHIPNAIYAHLDEDLSGEIVPNVTGRHPLPTIEAMSARLGAWGIDATTQVIAYDQGHGGIAARLWFLLKWLGHERVAVLNGGWQYWTKNDYPISDNIKTPTKKKFIPKPVEGSVVGVERLIDNLSTEELLVIDARNAERYNGEHEPIDRVAGHIPLAVSAPFIENIDSEGLFLQKEQLKQRFDHVLTGKDIEKTVLYCGSGVTACHNLLALDYIGKKGAKLYPGSWSHWITDSERPVE